MMENYKYTAGYLISKLYTAIAEGQTDPDLPLIIAHGGKSTALQTIEFTPDAVKLHAHSIKDKAFKRKRKAAAKQAAKRTHRRHDWRRVDWSQSTGTIAKRLGVSAAQVSTARRKYAKETLAYRKAD